MVESATGTRVRVGSRPRAAPRAITPLRPLATCRLVLRPAVPGDEPALAAVFASNPGFLRSSWPVTGPFDAAEASRYLAAEAGRQNGVCLSIVERTSRQVVGTAALLVPNPADGVPWIGLLILRADRQGLGLGTEAAAAMERWLARAGRPAVRLAVARGEIRARRFWERLGFRELAGAPRPYDGRERTTVVLAKRLGGSVTGRPGPVRCRRP